MSESHEDRIVYLPCAAPESALRFHLDENVARAVAVALRSRGFDVTTTHDAGLRSKPDDTQMAYAHDAQRVLVTRDKDFLQLCREEHPHSGVVYWPHGRSAKSSDMQALLIELLQQIVQSPAQAAEIAPHAKRSRRAKRRRQRAAAATRAAAVSRNLPAGLLVRGVVQAIGEQEACVLLDGGQHATILSQRFPTSPLSIGDEIEAVTLVYIRSRKTLHLSMRRNFALARTMPSTGPRLLRRNDYQWQTQLERERPVEIVVEGPHTVRVFGATAEAVRETACKLDREVPWTASAIITANTPEFKAWIMPAFGGLAKFARSTGTAMQHWHGGRVLICAATNRELDHVLNLIRTHVPSIDIHEVQSARLEALHACAWPRGEDT
jgi:predicted nuclease of predicted toxin-antitoxin system